jgi:SPP1 gp7 family putative phage head morphogenesis protein
MVGQEPEYLPEEEPKKQIKDFSQEKVWKGFLRKHEPLEMRMQNAVASYLYQQRSRVLAGLNAKEQGSVEVKAFEFNFDWTQEEKIFIKKMFPYISDSVFEGADFARALAGGKPDQQTLEGKLRSYINVRANQLPDITQREAKKIKGLIEESIKSGETVSQLADKIRQFYKNFTPFASMRIARTETTAALNGGAFQYYDAVGAKSKTWISALDENVRDTHVAQHGMTINLNERFPNGLMYPSDDGEAGEVINCRCTLITREDFSE